jgi:molybdopterin synthase sulfur carrier subunit
LWTVPLIRVAKAFRRHVDCPAMVVDGATVRASLDRYLESYPAVRSYVLDEHGAVRKHVVIFVDDDQIIDRTRLSDIVAASAEIHIFQALSGG